MSIETEFTRIISNINNAYTAIDDMDGDIPEQMNTANLASSIRTIPREIIGGSGTAVTGKKGQIVGFGDDGYPVAVEGWSNKNLLRNWDFHHPVNSRGKNVYDQEGEQTINGWELVGAGYDGVYQGKVTVNDGYITFEDITEEGAKPAQVRQPLLHGRFPDGIYTSSILLRNKLIWNRYKKADDIWILEDTNGITNRLHLLIDTKTNKPYDYFTICTDYDDPIDVIAVKLEMGSQQTLAHQDTDGNWVLNETSIYDLEYAKCAEYDPETGEWIGYKEAVKRMIDEVVGNIERLLNNL